MDVWVGIDIGGTKCAAVLARPADGKPVILAKSRFLTAEHPDPSDMLSVLADAVGEMCADLHASPVGIGLSCGGPLDSRNGLILSPPNLPGWDAVPVCGFSFASPARYRPEAVWDSASSALTITRSPNGFNAMVFAFLSCNYQLQP